MRFTFVDRVTHLQPGVKITTLKCLSLADDYLADHFPRFPVMPGVLMLQALAEAASLLVHATDDFAHSMVTLKEARHIRFADFVQPGCVLTVTAELLKTELREVHFKAQATVAGRMAVSGRLVLDRYNLADTRPDLAATDAYLRRHLKDRLAQVLRPHDTASPPGSSALIPSHSAAPGPTQAKV